MLKMNSYAALIAIFVLVAVIGVAAQTTAIGSKVPDLALKDQYDHEAKLSDYKGQLILLVCGDRTGNQYMNNWTKEVRKQFPGPNRIVTILPIANLKSVPGLLQGWVKGKFLKQTPDGKPNGPVLLDWKGDVARVFGFHDSVANVYLVDAAGVFRFSAFGKGASEEVQPLLRVIGDISANPSRSPNAK